MTAEPPTPDLKTLWQDQTQETDPMTLEQVQTLARRMEAQTRRSLFVGVGVVALGFFILGQGWQMSHDPLRRTGVALMAAGTMFIFVRAYALLLPRRDPAEPAASFLRRQLQRWLRYMQGGWVLSLAAIVPGLAVLGTATFRSSSIYPWAPWPPIALLVLWLVIMVVNTRRRARKLKQELAELDALLKS